MLQNLANYLLGTSTPQQPSQQPPNNVRLTTTPREDDWLLVDRTDRDSEGESEHDSASDADEWAWPPRPVQSEPVLTRASSTGSIPAAHLMEESWFITPPPCFTSAGPVNMETSPLENLLIEHPSMSVYHHIAATQYRRQRVRSRSASPLVEAEPIERRAELRNEGEGIRVRGAVQRFNRLNSTERQEKERNMSRRGQKAQVKRAYENVARQQLVRLNNVKQVLNRRQRRGEKSQGAQRACVNNNRKCC